MITVKKKIRQEILARRDNLTEAEKMKASVLLAERIIGHQWFYGAEYFLCFVSYGSEISTREILAEALRMGKKVYVPKVGAAEMKFYRITGLEDLEEGYKGIPEPAGISEEFNFTPDKTNKTLMLMPGVVFDGYRNRIGYGKGFYDRYLADKELLQLRTIAVGYKCQMVEELPAEETDIKPYQVICV